jgi:hypothetical protein
MEQYVSGQILKTAKCFWQNAMALSDKHRLKSLSYNISQNKK